MEVEKQIKGQQICHLKNEEEFFLLIEQYYLELGYELLETCCSPALRASAKNSAVCLIS